MTIYSCEKCDNGMVNTSNDNTCDKCEGDGSTYNIKPPYTVYKFHTPPDCTGYGYGKQGLKYYGVRRYAEGRWLSDDGTPDLAFIGYTEGGTAGGAPVFYGVELPWQTSGFHPNKIAYESACRACCEINSCAGGRTVKIDKCVQ